MTPADRIEGGVDVLAVLDEYASLVGDDHAVNICNCDITAARAAVVALVERSQAIVTLAGLRQHGSAFYAINPQAIDNLRAALSPFRSDEG